MRKDEGAPPSHMVDPHLSRWDICSILLIVYFVVLRLMWVQAGNFALSADDVAVFRHSIAALDKFTTGSVSLSAASPGFGAPYPPVVPAWAALHFLAFGKSTVHLAIASTWLWDLLLGVMAWVGGRRLSPAGGTLAVALVPLISTEPLVRNGFFIEPALSALTLTSLVCLEHSDLLRRRGWTLTAGLALGLGLLTKWTFTFFAFVPTTIFVAYALWKRTGGRLGAILAVSFLLTAGGVAACAVRQLPWPWLLPPVILLGGGLSWAFVQRRGEGLILSLGVLILPILLLAAPWYLLNYKVMLGFMSLHEQGTFDGRITLEEGWYVYLVALFGPLLGSLTTLLLGLGILRAVWPGAPLVSRLSLVGFVGGVVILTLIPWRTVRYLTGGLSLTLLPMVDATRGRYLRVGVTMLVVLASLFHQQSWLPTSWNSTLRNRLGEPRERQWQQHRFLGGVPRTDGGVTGRITHIRQLWPGIHVELMQAPPTRDGRLAQEVMSHLAAACAQPFNITLLTEHPWRDLRYLEGPLLSTYLEARGNTGGRLRQGLAPGHEPPPELHLAELMVAVDRSPPEGDQWVTLYQGRVEAISGPASLWVGVSRQERDKCNPSSSSAVEGRAKAAL